jgi:hypothetical protein
MSPSLPTAAASLRLVTFAEKWATAPGNLTDQDFPIFAEELRGILVDMHVHFFGSHGMLQFISSLAQWADMNGNQLPDGEVREMKAIPAASDDAMLPPPDNPTATQYNNWKARTDYAIRMASIADPIRDDVRVLFALLANSDILGNKTAASAVGSGSEEQIKLETPLHRWQRIQDAIGDPKTATIDLWKGRWINELRDVSQWLGEANDASRNLDRTGRDFTLPQKLDLFTSALQNNFRTRATLQLYKATFYTDAMRSFEGLCVYMDQQQLNVENETTREGAGYSAEPQFSQHDMDKFAAAYHATMTGGAAAAPPPAPPIFTQHQYDLGVAAAALGAPPPSSRRTRSQSRGGGGYGGRGSGPSSRGIQRGTYYCWLHGTGGHLGCDCRWLLKTDASCSDRWWRNDTRPDRANPFFVGGPGAISAADAQRATSAGQFPAHPGNAYNC